MTLEPLLYWADVWSVLNPEPESLECRVRSAGDRARATLRDAHAVRPGRARLGMTLEPLLYWADVWSVLNPEPESLECRVRSAGDRARATLRDALRYVV